MSAWASRLAGPKSTEITAIPLLLKRLALTSTLVATDAAGCQREIAQAELDRGGDLLAVKDNQPSLHNEVRCLLRSGAGLRTIATVCHMALSSCSTRVRSGLAA